MKIFVVVFVFVANMANAHSPDLSSMMIYEQNGKFLMLIKSSLTAFEGEINYIYGKNAYKTPEEFIQLVIKHVRKSSFVIINNDTIRFANVQVMLGHETTLFAELTGSPTDYKSIFVKNTMFKEMPNNQTELIVTTNTRPQKQYILYNGNDHQVKFGAKNGKWVVVSTSEGIFAKKNFILWTMLFLMAIIFVVVINNRTQNAASVNEVIEATRAKTNEF
ncbi:MAG: hypothetical protein ACKOC0_15220 [Cytophagales bacterium]